MNTSADDGAMRAWHKLDACLQETGVFHGIPMGIGEVEITTEDKQLLQLIQGVGRLSTESEEGEMGTTYGDWEVRNVWHSERQWRGQTGFVVVLEHPETRKARKRFMPESNLAQRLQMFVNSGGMRAAYTSVEAERTARTRLREALSQQQWAMYFKSDSFVERGRSGILYFLRKNHPTIVLRGTRPICTLCLHPLAFYTGTRAGVTPPSDEVLAHLLHIRADEHFYWRKANQLSLDDPVNGF